VNEEKWILSELRRLEDLIKGQRDFIQMLVNERTNQVNKQFQAKEDALAIAREEIKRQLQEANNVKHEVMEQAKALMGRKEIEAIVKAAYTKIEENKTEIDQLRRNKAGATEGKKVIDWLVLALVAGGISLLVRFLG